MKITEKILSAVKKIHPGEILFSVSIISVINYFYYPEDPLFLQFKINPFIILILFFSVFYGKVPGIMTLILSMTGTILALNFIIMFDDTAGFPDTLGRIYSIYSTGENYKSLVQFFFASFILSIIFGEIRDTLSTNIQKMRDQKIQLLKKITKIEQELNSIALVNEEYQDRILGQQNSLISLYSTMLTLNTLDLQSIYPNILEAIVKFSNAGKCSLWKYKRDESKLELLSSHGWEEQEKQEHKIMSDSDSITGWVARNNTLFSVKMLKKNQYLQKLDTKNNIITVPIIIEKSVWGIINIEAMPFVKYNLYSEQLIIMISDLVAPIIGNAIRFGEISMMGDIDPITKLRTINEMFMILKDEFSRSMTNNIHLSLAIVEISNSREILGNFTEKESLTLVREISGLANQVAMGKGLIFQYKETFQFSVILPNMDHDGAAIFCLSIIEQHSKAVYKINETIVYPEIVIGYSSLRQNHKSEFDLILLAENLMEMQKI